MQGGFSFCGVDIMKLGLEYAPEYSNTYVYSGATKNIEEQKVDAHDGGYFYGVSTPPKDFTLRCYFEDKDIRDGIFSKVAAVFRIGRTGKLVFQKRPWCWYTATVIGLENNQLVNFKNGFVTIKLRAYYPYARCDQLTIDQYDLNQYDILRNSAILTSAEKLPSMDLIADGETLDHVIDFKLYNPGTEPACVAIEIAGDAVDGISIKNKTTDQTVSFVALSSASTGGRYVVMDSMNGKTVLTDGNTSQLAFLYHDAGFLNLAPAYPILRNIAATWEDNATTVNVIDTIEEDVVGKYIYLQGNWHKILTMEDEHTLTLASTPGEAGFETTEIVAMNELTIVPKGNFSLTKLNFRYLPTFS